MVSVPAYTPPVTRATFRRSVVGAVVVVVVGLAALIPLGYTDYALAGCGGVALGVLNSYFTFRSVLRFATSSSSRARFSGSALGRLAVITVLALACATLFPPAGIAVFAGLAVFQLLAIASAMLPLIKEIRQ